MKLSFRVAAMAAAMMLNTAFGATGAHAQDSATPVVVAAATPTSGMAWISEGTTTAQPQQQPAVASPASPDSDLHADSLQELVGDMPTETELSPELKCLAQAVYFEARGEPLDGQLAVAEVVINRAVSGLYPANYCEVVTQRAQFSFVHRGRIPQPDESSSAWRRAKAVALIAQQDLWDSKAADALYFHATYVKPNWARQKVQLAQIDTHIFYR